MAAGGMRHAGPAPTQCKSKGAHRPSIGLALLVLLFGSDLIHFQRLVDVERALILPSLHSSLHEEMHSESSALFKRTHDLATATVHAQHADRSLVASPPWRFFNSEAAASVQGFNCVGRAPVVSAGSSSASGGGTEGNSAGTEGSTAISRSDGGVICTVCGTCSKHINGHNIHCARSSGRCRNAPCMLFSTWKEARDEAASARAVDQLRRDAFCLRQAGTLSDAYTEMKYSKMAQNAIIDACKAVVSEHVTACKDEVLRRFAVGHSEAEVKGFEAMVKDIFDAHKTIETPAQLEQRVQPVVARRRELIDRPNSNGEATGPRSDDHVYDVPIADGLKAILRDDPSLWNQLRQAADSWAEPKAGDSLNVFHDISDGAVFREHPELGVQADRSDGAVRTGFILYYDEVEVCNALGAFTGVHKIGLFYWALLNLPAHKRMDLCNIHLATVVLDSDMSYYGAAQIVSGVQGEPNYPEGSSIGASLRALHEGVSFQEPSGGTFEDVCVRGWLVVVSADFPAAAVLTGTMVGTSARRFCRECCVDRRKAGYNEPCSFCEPCTPEAPPLRTLEQRAEDMRTCGNDEAKMSSAGWKSWSHAFERCGPYFNICVGIPYDMMHTEPEGLLKGECAHFIFYCIRIKGCFELDDLNKRLDAYPFPGGGKQIPYFAEGLLKGRDAKELPPKKRSRDDQAPKYVPAPGAHVHMTSGQMLIFSKHSPQIFLDLGVPPDDPAFAAWLTHLSYMNILMQHSLARDEVKQADQLIQQHQKQLKALSTFYPDIWKPKHHYACHFASDVLNFGPLRHFWCMRFEALNQLFKRIAVGGTYRDTTRRLALFWCTRSALSRQAASWNDWAVTHILSGTDSIRLTLGPESPAHILEAVSLWPDNFAGSVTTSYISELTHLGHHIFTGQSWLLLQLDEDEKWILAYVRPLTGIFTLDGAYFFYVDAYEGLAIPEATPTRMIEISAGSPHSTDVISLDEILAIKVLWPQAEEKLEDGGSQWSFVEM